jgi:hypothetical protein
MIVPQRCSSGLYVERDLAAQGIGIGELDVAPEQLNKFHGDRLSI